MPTMIYPVALLLVVLVVAIVMFVVDARNTRLRLRVEALGDSEPAIDESAPSIRIAERGGGSGAWFARLMKVPVDMPGARVVATHWVVAFGLLLAGVVVVFANRWLGLPAALPLAAAAGLLVARAIFSWEVTRYRGLLQLQLPDAIEMVVSAIRAGLPVGEAFRGVAEDAPAPTRDEFQRIINEMALGTTADKALLGVYLRTRVTEYSIFAVTVNVQSRSGGRLVESVQKLAETVRHRLAMEARAQALAGEAKMSAFILCALPVVAGAGLSLIRPGYLDPLFNDPRGQRLLMIGAVGLTLGVLTMRRMIRKATSE